MCGWLNADGAKQCCSCSKRKPRAKKAKPPPSFRPWACVVLAVDEGACSGWAVWVKGKLASHGEFNIYTEKGVREVVRVVETAKSFGALHGIPWVAIFELPWGGNMGLGTTKAEGYWTFPLRNAQLPLARIGHVYPATWRARTLASGMHAARRVIVKAHEVEVASKLTKRSEMGEDQAAAILIGKWATQAGEVGEMLPKNARVTV